MDHKNFALKSSWLPQAGTSERRIILKKLKRNLERLGLTRDEVYTGLVQLTESPQVLVTRWRAYVVPNEKSNSTTIGPEILSAPKEIERTENGEDTVPEAKNDVMDDVDNGEIVPPPPKSKTPELLDEEVGGESYIFAKIPRKVVSLNFQAFKAQSVKVNHRQTTTCTEISVADSSVSDHENVTYCHATSGGNEQKLQKKDIAKTKKPKIVEDLTCVEGTIFAKRFKPSRFAMNRVDQPENKTIHKSEEEKTTIVTAAVFTKCKRRAQWLYYTRKKSRIRRRFRQLFGNSLTLSELDEEDSLIERFSVTPRRKKTRNSSDSGFSLTELNFEDMYVSQSGSEPRVSSEEPMPSSPEATTINDIKEEKDEPNTLFRSMPLLNSLSSSCNSIVEIPRKAVPDSSTNSLEASIVQADSSVVEPSIHKEKLTILVSPVDINSPDAFAPVSLEIDIPCENAISAPTSTTEHFSEILTIQKTKESESVRECKHLPNDVEINISNDGECKVVLSPGHAKDDAIVIDYLGSKTINESQTEVSLMITQEEKKSLNKGIETMTPVLEPKLETVVTDQEKPKISIEIQSEEKEKENKNNEAITQRETIQPILPSSSSSPRIRVLLPSELGSRWCPTPANTISPCSQTVTSVPSGTGPAPIVENNHSQGNGIPIVQPAQSFQNLPCKTSEVKARTMSGMETASYENSSNNVNGWQRCCNDPRYVSSAQTLLKAIAEQKSFWSIVQLLHSLNECIENSKCVYLPEIVTPLQNQFIAEKSLLRREMAILSSLSGRYIFNDLVEYIIRSYEKNVLDTGKITRHQILTVITTEKLSTMCLTPVANYESQIHYNHLASQPQSRPRPPPPYPTHPNTAYLPQNSVNLVPPRNSSQSVMLANLNQCTSPRPSPPPALHSPYFTAQQWSTLQHQIRIYQQLYLNENRLQSRQSITLPTANLMPQNVPSPVESVPRLPILYDSASRGLPGVQNIQRPAPTKPVQKRKYTRRPAKEINDSRRNVAAVTGGRHIDVSVHDILQSLVRTCEPTIHNRIIDNNNNNNEQRIKVQTSTCSPIPKASINSENIEGTERTISVAEETMSSVEKETTCSIEKNTTCPIEDEVTSPIEEETTFSGEDETTFSAEEETACPTEEADTCPVEEETTCPIEEGTKCVVGKEDACPVEEETTCPIEEGTKCLVKEEDTCPVEEETTCLVKEETTCPVVETPHSNNPEKKNKSGSFSEYETIDILDEPETIEMDISSDRHVSVILHNNSKTENSEIQMIEDTESNFSILEVMSITKDIFDNMGTMEEELGDPTFPKAANDVIENHEDSTTNSDLRSCLQCGEPSSVVCEQCYEAFYCSSECHEAHWTEHHYLTCKPVPVEALAQFEMTSTNLPCLKDKLSPK